jgi:hypothetical protein
MAGRHGWSGCVRAMQTSGRIQSVDFWRGAALVEMFVDHVPGNPIALVTSANFGFSDAAEIFVFLSGLVLGYINWPRVAEGRPGRAAMRCLRRAGQVYLVQIGLSLAAIALFGLALAVHGRELQISGGFFQHPGAGLIGLVLLTYQFDYYNILSLYVVLLVMAAGFFLVLGRSALLAFALSAALYLACRAGLTLPSWPQGIHTWFFDPFAWQFLFYLGVGAGVLRRRGPLPYRRSLIVAAGAYLVFSLLAVRGAFGPVHDIAAGVASHMETDKTILGWARLLHFLALAYVVSQVRLADFLLRLPGSGAVAELGRQSLSVFAAGTILSTIDQILLPAAPHGFPSDLVDIVVVALGIVALVGLVRYLTRRQAALKAASSP